MAQMSWLRVVGLGADTAGFLLSFYKRGTGVQRGWVTGQRSHSEMVTEAGCVSPSVFPALTLLPCPGLGGVPPSSPAPRAWILGALACGSGSCGERTEATVHLAIPQIFTDGLSRAQHCAGPKERQRRGRLLGIGSLPPTFLGALQRLEEARVALLVKCGRQT